MEDEVKDGGPAFPAEWAPHGRDFSQGMSLRDYFAAKALPKCLDEFWGEEDGGQLISGAAYQIADAMLAERAKGGGK